MKKIFACYQCGHNPCVLSVNTDIEPAKCIFADDSSILIDGEWDFEEENRNYIGKDFCCNECEIHCCLTADADVVPLSCAFSNTEPKWSEPT